MNTQDDLLELLEDTRDNYLKQIALLASGEQAPVSAQELRLVKDTLEAYQMLVPTSSEDALAAQATAVKARIAAAKARNGTKGLND